MRPSDETLQVVWIRDDGNCAWCGLPIWGERGFNWSLGHRRPAGMGGDRRPETHAAGNLVLLHGSGVTACHGLVESFRTDAEAKGFLISKHSVELPSSVVIEHAIHGLCRLLDDGSVEPVPASWSEAS